MANGFLGLALNKARHWLLGGRGRRCAPSLILWPFLLKMILGICILYKMSLSTLINTSRLTSTVEHHHWTKDFFKHGYISQLQNQFKVTNIFIWPNYSRSTHNHNTRFASNHHIVVPSPRTSLSRKTVIYRAITIWNALALNKIKKDYVEASFGLQMTDYQQKFQLF